MKYCNTVRFLMVLTCFLSAVCAHAGKKILPNQISMNWAHVLSYNAAEQGTGAIYAELDRNANDRPTQIMRLHVVVDRMDQNGQSYYDETHNLALSELKSEQVVKKKGEHTVVSIQADKNFGASGGEITLKVLKLGNPASAYLDLHSSKTLFLRLAGDKIETRVKMLDRSIQLFNSVELVLQRVGRDAVGVKELIFRSFNTVVPGGNQPL